MTKSPTILTNEGPAFKNVVIKTNVVAKPDSTFPVVIQPARIEFADGDRAETMEFTITNRATQPLTPRVVSSPRSLVSITLPASIPASESATGTVKLKKAGLKGSFEKSVTIQLDDQAKSRFTIPIKRGERMEIVPEVVPATTGH